MTAHQDRNPVLYWLITGLSTYYFSTYHHLRVEGAEHIPERGGALFASNHTSFFDPPALASASPRSLDFLARKSLFSNRLFGSVIRELNAIPIDQENPDMTGLKTIIKRLKSGRMVVLFPEGARSWDGALQPGQPGIGMVIEKAGVPVVPARFFGMHEAWPRASSFRCFTPVTLVIAPPIRPFSALTDKRARFQDLSDQIMQAIAAIQPPDGITPSS
ncbi:MAG: lysophospholipid acyltransferase family protein [Candidatus Methylacidiphilales bacterium]